MSREGNFLFKVGFCASNVRAEVLLEDLKVNEDNFKYIETYYNRNEIVIVVNGTIHDHNLQNVTYHNHDKFNSIELEVPCFICRHVDKTMKG